LRIHRRTNLYKLGRKNIVRLRKLAVLLVAFTRCRRSVKRLVNTI
jgi:hypothetical protein